MHSITLGDVTVTRITQWEGCAPVTAQLAPEGGRLESRVERGRHLLSIVFGPQRRQEHPDRYRIRKRQRTPPTFRCRRTLPLVVEGLLTFDFDEIYEI
jgi:hypothetical protein